MIQTVTDRDCQSRDAPLTLDEKATRVKHRPFLHIYLLQIILYILDSIFSLAFERKDDPSLAASCWASERNKNQPNSWFYIC